jgi:hypothetical protein
MADYFGLGIGGGTLTLHSTGPTGPTKAPNCNDPVEP